MKKILIIAYSLLMLTLTLRAEERWIIKSEYLSKADTVLIYKPVSYHKNKSYPLVYLLHGYSANYRQWSQTADLQKLSDQYGMIIICPDGYVSWYVNSPYDKGSRMEDFFFKELVAKVHNTFRIEERNIFISGLSMGGYGALRYFLLHDDYFNTAASTSGGLTVDYKLLEQVSLLFFKNTRVTNDLSGLLGNYLQNDWHQYNIAELLKKYQAKKPFLIDCGTEDVLYPVTTQLKTVADSLKLPVTFIAQPGGHDTQYWRKSIKQHFLYFAQHLRKGKQ